MTRDDERAEQAKAERTTGREARVEALAARIDALMSEPNAQPARPTIWIPIPEFGVKLTRPEESHGLTRAR